MTKRENDDMLSIIPELDITTSQLRKHVAQSPPAKNPAMKYSSLAAMVLAVGISSYVIFGNRREAKIADTKNFITRDVHPLMLPFIQTKPDASGKPVYEVLLTNNGTTYFKTIDSL